MRRQSDEHRKQKQGLLWTICSARHENKIESLKKTLHERGIEDAAVPLKNRGSTNERIEALWDHSSFHSFVVSPDNFAGCGLQLRIDPTGSPLGVLEVCDLQKLAEAHRTLTVEAIPKYIKAWELAFQRSRDAKVWSGLIREQQLLGKGCMYAQLFLNRHDSMHCLKTASEVVVCLCLQIGAFAAAPFAADYLLLLQIMWPMLATQVRG
jgi:hypothetical protein